MLPSRTHHLRHGVFAASLKRRGETRLVSARCRRLSSLGLPTQLTGEAPHDASAPDLSLSDWPFRGSAPRACPRHLTDSGRALHVQPSKDEGLVCPQPAEAGSPFTADRLVSRSLLDVPESQTLNFHGAGSESDAQIPPLSSQRSLFLGLQRAAGFPPWTEGLGQRAVLSEGFFSSLTCVLDAFSMLHVSLICDCGDCETQSALRGWHSNGRRDECSNHSLISRKVASSLGG